MNMMARSQRSRPWIWNLLNTTGVLASIGGLWFTYQSYHGSYASLQRDYAALQGRTEAVERRTAFSTLTPQDVPLPVKRNERATFLETTGYMTRTTVAGEKVFATTRVGGQYYYVVEPPIDGNRWRVNVYAPTTGEVSVQLYLATGEARRLFEEWEQLVAGQQGQVPKRQLDEKVEQARAASFYYKCCETVGPK